MVAERRVRGNGCQTRGWTQSNGEQFGNKKHSLFTTEEVDHGPGPKATMANTGHSNYAAIVEVTKLPAALGSCDLESTARCNLNPPAR